ncbi:MAG TPA: hypothetical protein VHM93_03105, partial [Candidatus Acidoferrum sp.]|nr:hypothetical protein [Candidatus Acidoferrum sp.]
MLTSTCGKIGGSRVDVGKERVANGTELGTFASQPHQHNDTLVSSGVLTTSLGAPMASGAGRAADRDLE